MTVTSALNVTTKKIDKPTNPSCSHQPISPFLGLYKGQWKHLWIIIFTLDPLGIRILGGTGSKEFMQRTKMSIIIELEPWTTMTIPHGIKQRHQLYSRGFPNVAKYLQNVPVKTTWEESRGGKTLLIMSRYFSLLCKS